MFERLLSLRNDLGLLEHPAPNVELGDVVAGHDRIDHVRPPEALQRDPRAAPASPPP